MATERIFFEQARKVPSYLGKFKLTRVQSIAAYLVLYHGKCKNRHKLTKNKTISRCGKSQRYAKAYQEPWLLATSLECDDEIAKRIVVIYKQRMRIEENIRDTKCSHYGLGLKRSLSRSTGRLNVLLLIAAIATFAAWLVGLLIIHQGRWADFQTHSAKVTSALSKVYLGREAFKKGINLTKRQFNQVLYALYQLSLTIQLEGSPMKKSDHLSGVTCSTSANNL